MRFIYPNFRKNIINISSTISGFLGNEIDVPKLEILEKELQKEYKNIVFIILDGCGIDIIKNNLNPNDLLYKNIVMELTSTFPSTTTNATTTLMSAKYPGEHGWLAWSMYFQENNKCINIFRDENNYDKTEKVENNFMFKRFPFEAYYNNAKTDYEINTLFPAYVKNGISKNNVEYEGVEEYFKAMERIINKEGKKFLYAYSPTPDGVMHVTGTKSFETKAELRYINDAIQGISERCKDTLFIITADHGQIDITEEVKLFLDEKLMNMLELPLFLEARATSIKVKKAYKNDFAKLFTAKYGKDFKLFKTKDLIKKGVFGLRVTINLESILGDFIAVANSNNKMIKFSDLHDSFKGHHTSLTREMLVPLIIIKT